MLSISIVSIDIFLEYTLELFPKHSGWRTINHRVCEQCGVCDRTGHEQSRPQGAKDMATCQPGPDSFRGVTLAESKTAPHGAVYKAGGNTHTYRRYGTDETKLLGLQELRTLPGWAQNRRTGRLPGIHGRGAQRRQQRAKRGAFLLESLGYVLFGPGAGYVRQQYGQLKQMRFFSDREGTRKARL